MNTGELIRKYRKERKLTLKQLSKSIGISEQAISQYERGVRNANLETLIKISNILEINIETFTEKQPTFTQSVLKKLLDDNSLENISTETDINIHELNSIYLNGTLPSDYDIYSKLYSYLGLDKKQITKIISSDIAIYRIYNHITSDELDNLLSRYNILSKDIDTVLEPVNSSNLISKFNHSFDNTEAISNILSCLGVSFTTNHNDDIVELHHNKNNTSITLDYKDFKKLSERALWAVQNEIDFIFNNN